MMREKVKKLWKLCFNDSEEFTELYFRLRYNNDINIAIQSGEEVIAALQMLPYPMTFEGEDIHTAYISGACTHPDYRNRGVMHELLSQAFARMLHNNVALSTLIPAEPWLFDYYGRSGYAPVFRYAEETFIASGTPTADTGLTLEMSAEYTEKRYEYLFLLLNTLAWCAIGFVVWAVVSIFAFRGTEWMFTFVGYFGLIPGFIGGVVEAWRNER